MLNSEAKEQDHHTDREGITGDLVLKLYGLALDPTSYAAFESAWHEALSQDAESFQGSGLEHHLEQAASIIWRGLGEPPQEQVLAEEVHNLRTPAAMIDASGSVLSHNKQWRDAGADPHSVFRVAGEENQGRIRRLLRNASRAPHGDTRIARFHLPTGNVPTLITITPHHSVQDIFLAHLLRGDWVADIDPLLKDVFELTSAELIALQGIVRGHSNSEIARNSGKSVETIRSQTKSLFKKMQVENRHGAARLALHVGLLKNGDATDCEANSAAILHTPAGRALQIVERGDRSGKPFLYLHGMLFGHHFNPAFEAELKKRGLRAICPDRPGCGASVPPHDWRRAGVEWIDAIPLICDHAGVKNLPVVTHATGMAFGALALHHHPSLTGNMLAISAMVLDPRRRSVQRFPGIFKTLAFASRISPRAIRSALTLCVQYSTRGDGLLTQARNLYASSPSDLKALQQPETVTCLRRGERDAMDGAIFGCMCDTMVLSGKLFDWPDLMTSIPTGKRILMLNGAEDEVGAPADLQAYAGRSVALISTSRRVRAG